MIFTYIISTLTAITLKNFHCIPAAHLPQFTGAR